MMSFFKKVDRRWLAGGVLVLLFVGIAVARLVGRPGIGQRMRDYCSCSLVEGLTEDLCAERHSLRLPYDRAQQAYFSSSLRVRYLGAHLGCSVPERVSAP